MISSLVHRCMSAQTWSVVWLSSASGPEGVAFGELLKNLSTCGFPTRGDWTHGGACGLGVIPPGVTLGDSNRVKILGARQERAYAPANGFGWCSSLWHEIINWSSDWGSQDLVPLVARFQLACAWSCEVLHGFPS
jgi:hypothetical protein